MGGKDKATGKIPAAQNPEFAFLQRFLIYVGKPLFIILLLLFTIAFFFLQIPLSVISYILKVASKTLRRNRLKKSGYIFVSKFFDFKLRLENIRRRLSEFNKGYKKFSWNFQVLILAVIKLAGKILPGVSFYFPKLNRILSTLLKSFKPPKLVIPVPKLKIPRISAAKLLTFILVFVFTSSFLIGIIFWQLVLKDLPSPQELAERKLSVSTKIYDRNRELLYTIYKDERRTPIPLEEIPIQVRLATIAAEDKEFYSHKGFSVKGIARAIFKDLKEGKLSGGSTITQQLVKNALLTPEKTVIRKLKEIILSIEVEQTYSKDKILEMYLNEVPYGGTAYGIEEAAQTYFNKKASELTLGESALLAGLPQSPTKYSPFGTNSDYAFVRQKEILRRMTDKGFITEEQKKGAEVETIIFTKSKVSVKAPHFVFYVRDVLEEKYGKEVVEKGGLEVETSLDYKIQKLAEEVLREEVDKLANLNVTNGAVIVANPKTGEILAMVGSYDFFDTEHGGNVNVTTRPRPPGSSIKIVNYAHALSNGLNAATIIPDTPTTFTVEGQEPYIPKNYEGEFRGNITLRSALAESRNIPAVKILSSYGVDKMIEMGRKMGITTWENPKNYGLSLTLGGGDVKLIDLARAYSVLANYGKRPEIISVLRVTNFEGKILQEFKCEEGTDNPIKLVQNAVASQAAQSKELTLLPNCPGEQVLDPRVSFIITDILKDNVARAPSFGSNSLMVVKNHKEVAVKTGTSNDLRDNLTVGYTPDYLVAVWIGNNDNSEMSRIASGVTGATPIFNRIMSALIQSKESEDWPVPEGLVELPICPFTGTLACEGCPIKMEWFLVENKPERACNKEWFEGLELSPTISPPAKNNRGNYFDNIVRDNLKNIKKKFGR